MYKKKYVFLTALSVVLIVFLIPKAAHADIFDIALDSALNAGIGLIRGLMIGILALFSWILFAVGSLLDLTVKYTIIEMGEFVNGVNSISIAWKFFRDIANMFFIFVLTYAGITTILGVQRSDWKTILRNIVIAGLLINFSLFFTKIPIDISNIISIQLYKAMTSNVTSTVAGQQVSGMAVEFMNHLKVQTIYRPSGEGVIDATEVNLVDQLSTILISSIFGITIILITACVFLAIAAMLLHRFVKLISLMILSPLYFLGMILPSAKEYGGRWKQDLISQCIFPVVLFGLLYVVVLFLRTGTLSKFSAGTFAEGLNGSGTIIANLLINYGLIMAMIVGSLTAAQKAGGEGGRFMDNRIKSLQKFPGRLLSSTANTAARTASWAGGAAVRQVVRGGDTVAEKSGAKKWATTRLKAGAATQSEDLKLKGNNTVTKIAGGAINIATGLTGIRLLAAKATRGASSASLKAAGNFANNASFDAMGVEKRGFAKIDSDEREKLTASKVSYEEQVRKNEFKKAQTEFKDVSKIKVRTNDDGRNFVDIGDGVEVEMRDDERVRGVDMLLSEVKKIRKQYTGLLKNRRPKELDKVKFNDIKAAADILTAEQFTYLVGKESKLTDQEKDTLTTERVSMPKVLMERLESAEREFEEENDPVQKAARENALKAAQKKVNDSLKKLTDKEMEVIAPHFFDTNKDRTSLLETFAKSISQSTADKLKKLDKLGDDDKLLINKTRKAVFQAPLNAFRTASATVNRLRMAGTSSGTEFDRAQAEANRQEKKLKSAFARSSGEQIAKMGSEFVTDPKIIELLDGKHLKKLVELAEDMDSVTINGQERNPFEYIAEEKIRMLEEHAAGNREEKPKGIDFILRNENSGIFDVDADEVRTTIQNIRSTTRTQQP